MINWENKYIELIESILSNGELKECRNGYAMSTFGNIIKIDTITQGFPILQGRKIFYKSVLGELAAFLSVAQSVKEFEDHGCKYWKSWAGEDGKLNLDYGRTWRNFNGVNQLDLLRQELKNNKNSRRLIVSGWRPDTVPNLSLPCCHILYQWYVSKNNILNMIWYQRSVDTMVGLPSNFILAATWNMLLANELGMESGELTFMLGDTHIYEEHLGNVEVYLESAKNAIFNKIETKLAFEATIDTFNNSMLDLVNYNVENTISFELKK